MRKFFTWLNEFYQWKMFQWIWGLTTKQAAHIRKRIEEDEHKIVERKRMTVYGEVKETTMLFKNPMF